MKKLLIFHPTIAPYRVDFFNDLCRNFSTKIILDFRNLKDQKFAYDKIEEKFAFTPEYLNPWIKVGHREFYRGHLGWLASGKPDVVLVGEYGLAMWKAIFYRFFSREKYKIVTICDDSLKIAQECSGGRKKSRDLAMHFLNGIILCNPQAEAWYREYCDVPTYVFPIIHKDSVIEEELRASNELVEPLIQELNLSGKKVFLFVGRLVAVKNLEYLVHSFAEASKKHPEMELLMVGDDGDTGGEVRLGIEEFVRANHCTNIHLLGRKEGKELYAVYQAAQVLVLPSISEAFGAVANEALAAGEYAMISRNAGASCLVNEDNGEVMDITEPAINFENMIRKVESVALPWQPRASKMPISYDERMDGLTEWIGNMVKE